jgi:hypothetical protein
MHVVIRGIKSTSSPIAYIVDMTIDGEARAFEFEVRLPDLISVGTERAFDEIFRGTRGAGKIASAVVKHHKGESIDFPINIEIIDFKQPRPNY